MPGGGARGKNVEHLKNEFFFVEVFYKSMSLQPLIRKHSYLNPKYPVGSMPGEWGKGYRSKSRKSSKSSIFVFKFSRSLYLCNYLSESIHT